jgi:hypothetical protein
MSLSNELYVARRQESCSLSRYFCVEQNLLLFKIKVLGRHSKFAKDASVYYKSPNLTIYCIVAVFCPAFCII